MFLHDFSPCQKTAFLSLARAVILADARLEAEELTLLNRLRGEMSLGPTDDPQEPPPEWGALPGLFDTPQSRCAVILELHSLAYADGAISVEEYAVIRDASRALSISKGQRLAMENWVVRMMSMYWEAESFWREMDA